jgi:hypothetical protein
MKMALAAMVLMAVGHPANAQRLPGSNSELGCKELNVLSTLHDAGNAHGVVAVAFVDLQL